MREVEVGDTVASQGVVIDITSDSYRIITPSGNTRWVDTKVFQLVEPPPFSVGDRVDVRTNGNNRVIDRISIRYRYHLEDSPDDVTHTREEFTRVSPKPEPNPEYRVVRVNDELRLQRIHDNPHGLAATWVSMSDPEKVEATIVEWARDFRIDAGAVRKLAAEPQIIDRQTLGEGHHITAIRTGSGWYVTLTANYVRDLDSTYLPGAPQPEPFGKFIFPGTDGPYKAKP